MHIEFAPVDELYIKESVKNGYFKSEAEAVRYAVRAVREQQEDKRLRLLNALRAGEEDVAAGRTIPHTTNQLEGIFSHLKEKILIHRGLSEKRKKQAIIFFLKNHLSAPLFFLYAGFYVYVLKNICSFIRLTTMKSMFYVFCMKKWTLSSI